MLLLTSIVGRQAKHICSGPIMHIDKRKGYLRTGVIHHAPALASRVAPYEAQKRVSDAH